MLIIFFINLGCHVECSEESQYPRLELPGTNYMPLNRQVKHMKNSFGFGISPTTITEFFVTAVYLKI